MSLSWLHLSPYSRNVGVNESVLEESWSKYGNVCELNWLRMGTGGTHGTKVFNACRAQGRPPVRTKMVIGTDPSSPAFAKVLQGSSPWGRGRVAQLCNESAPPLRTCNSLQVLAVPRIHGRHIHPEADGNLACKACNTYDPAQKDQQCWDIVCTG